MKLYYIKKRYNPQLGTYYVPMGQLSKAEAKRNARAIYGQNHMLSFVTLIEYDAAIAKLKEDGEKVN